MSEPTIICPKCKNEIKLTESLAAPLIESTKRDYEARLVQKDTAMAAREKEIRDREEAVAKAREAIDAQVMEKLKAERAKIAAEELKKAKATLSTDLDQKTKEIADLQEVLKVREGKLAEAQKAQADFLKKQRELDDAKREVDLTVEKRVQESLGLIRQQARKEAEEEQKLKVAEKEQLIAAMQKQIEDLKRRAEQGSQQLQGEVQELELESLLRSRFPRDTVEPVPKGEFGGDALQRVVGPLGQVCGTILWESKRTKNWSDGWLAKLRDDQRAAKAEISVLITQVLPKGVEAFDLIEGVYPEVQQKLAAKVEESLAPAQGELKGVVEKLDVAAVVKKATELAVQQTIGIPRILVIPKGEVSSGFHPFKLEVASIHYQPVERDILIQHLRTHQQETLTARGAGQTELRLEDYLVSRLIDFDDISYDHHSDLLYDLAGQMVTHLRSYLKNDEEVLNVLQSRRKELAEAIHAQMQAHHWEKSAGYEVVVSKGFMELKQSAVTAPDAAVQNFRHPVVDKSKIAQLAFGGFSRCLFPIQKFQSDTERVLAVILDRDAQKWFRPGRGLFQIHYKWGNDTPEYQPDFVAEADEAIYMLEAKARNDMEDGEVQAKKEAAVQWCRHASDHVARHGGKPWRYLLIPHDVVHEGMTLGGLAAGHRVK